MKSVLKHLRGAGLVLGVIGGAFFGGFFSQKFGHEPGADLATGDVEGVRDGFFKATALHATASLGNESLTMATGEVDSGLEAVYLLDGLTGELHGGLISNASRKFTIQYTYSKLMQDLGADNVKNPKFLMVTGEAQIKEQRNSPRLARCVLYVAELNSGWAAAYGAPWDGNAYNKGQTASAKLVFLDKFKFRETMLRP